jgi:hypothetical protein
MYKEMLTSIDNTITISTCAWNPSVSIFNNAHFLPAGSYSITVTDANNFTATVIDIITQPTQLIPEVSTAHDTICADGTTNIMGNAYGGSPFFYPHPPYNYLWSNGGLSIPFQIIKSRYFNRKVDKNECL